MGSEMCIRDSLITLLFFYSNSFYSYSYSFSPIPIHIKSLLYLFISSVIIPLFVIALYFSFPFIHISTHPILSLLLCYSISILQSILLSILPHYSTPFSFILSSFFPFIPFHIILSLPFYSHPILHPIPF